jgi:hypothetical protein
VAPRRRARFTADHAGQGLRGPKLSRDRSKTTRQVCDVGQRPAEPVAAPTAGSFLHE